MTSLLYMRQTEEVQIQVKKTRAPAFKETNLVSAKGIWAIADDFPRLHLKGRGSEVSLFPHCFSQLCLALLVEPCFATCLC